VKKNKGGCVNDDFSLHPSSRSREASSY
jgi:hypothetical protein